MDAADTFTSTELTLNTGAKMPAVGFGCWQVPTDQCADVIYAAIKNGYRLIDEAAVYGNEKEAGEGIKRAIDEGIVTRADLFVTSKLWNTNHRKEHVKPAFMKTLHVHNLEALGPSVVLAKMFLLTAAKTLLRPSSKPKALIALLAEPLEYGCNGGAPGGLTEPESQPSPVSQSGLFFFSTPEVAQDAAATTATDVATAKPSCNTRLGPHCAAVP